MESQYESCIASPDTVSHASWTIRKMWIFFAYKKNSIPHTAETVRVVYYSQNLGYRLIPTLHNDKPH